MFHDDQGSAASSIRAIAWLSEETVFSVGYASILIYGSKSVYHDR